MHGLIKSIGVVNHTWLARAYQSAHHNIKEKQMTSEITIPNKKPLSKKWQRRFELFEQLDASNKTRSEIVSSNEFRQLKFRERSLISMNYWGFFLGPLYYFYHRMPLKACLILAISFIWSSILITIEHLAIITIPSIVFSATSSVIAALYVNFDVYRKHTHGEVMWPKFPMWCHHKALMITLAVGAFIINVGIGAFITTHEYYSNAASSDFFPAKLNCSGKVLYVTDDELSYIGKPALCNALDNLE
ncbi:DUF2628 domain-containing protein [Vibrio sp. CAIM 722]|uniref:DUF2628 domain-containing protein n=2 Tax=Vibrio TaxID=662 RepID=A0A7X4RVB9_9VIBR|nr:DUF2628 domain-containing protein [Vibrio eleionomae]